MRSKGLWLLLVIAVGLLAWWLLRDSRSPPSTVNVEKADPAASPEAPTLLGTTEATEGPATRRAPSCPTGHARIDVEVVDLEGRRLAGVPVALHVRALVFVSSHQSGGAPSVPLRV